MLKYLSIFFLLIASISIYPKDLPKTYDAPVDLNKADQNRLKRANDMLKEGYDMWNDLNTRYNPENVTNYKIDSAYNKDAYPLLIKIVNIFTEANELKYNIYHKNCTEFWTKHRYDSPSGLENAKRFQKEAQTYIDKAQVNKRVADNFINEYVKSYDRYYEAISLEIIAGKKEGRALQIYRDWPVHYSYDWDEDIEKDLFKPVEKPLIASADSQVVVPPNAVVIAPPVETPHDSTIIYYSVQIAAHTIPMTENHIRQSIYHGGMTIREIHEDGWYKYLIGRYTNVDEAIKLLNDVNVDKAFVVAYKNGHRVPLKEVVPDGPDSQQNK